jgi:hypothetical protein
VTAPSAASARRTMGHDHAKRSRARPGAGAKRAPLGRTLNQEQPTGAQRRRQQHAVVSPLGSVRSWSGPSACASADDDRADARWIVSAILRRRSGSSTWLEADLHPRALTRTAPIPAAARRFRPGFGSPLPPRRPTARLLAMAVDACCPSPTLSLPPSESKGDGPESVSTTEPMYVALCLQSFDDSAALQLARLVVHHGSEAEAAVAREPFERVAGGA